MLKWKIPIFPFPQDFAKGMNLYFNRFQYGNAATDDLWKTLEEVSNKPISSVMSMWTRQMGYPVISVRSEQVGDSRKLYLKQSQFWADGSPTSGGLMNCAFLLYILSPNNFS